MAEGALLKSGGKQINQELGGFYMEPTVFSNINSDMQIAQEENFWSSLKYSNLQG